MLHLFNNFYLLRPLVLLLIPVFIIAFIYYSIKFKVNKSIANFIDEKLINEINIKTNISKNNSFNRILIALSVVISILAISGPSIEQKYHNAISNDKPVVILLDVSWSMNSTDLLPTRLERAKFKINDFLNVRKSERNALVIYAKNPFVVTPFSSDKKTIANFLEQINPEIMPEYGDNLLAGLKKAKELINNVDNVSNNILLFTDSINSKEIAEYKKYIEDNNLTLAIIGVGKNKGPILINSSGKYLYNSAGDLIFSNYDFNSIKNLASSSSHIYTTEISLTDSDINQVINFFNSQNLLGLSSYSNNLKVIDQGYIYYKDFGAYFLALVALLLLPVFRQGFILVLMLIIFSPQTKAIDFFKNSDQLGYKQYNLNNFKQAEKLFNNKAWKAVAAYQAKDYQKTEKLLENNQDALSQYNLGNALAKQMKFDAAIASYKKVLANDKAIKTLKEKAKFNKELLEKIKQQNKNQQTKSKQESQDKQKQEKDKNTQQNNNPQETKQNQKSPNQKQDGGKQNLDSAQNEQNKQKNKVQQKNDNNKNEASEKQNNQSKNDKEQNKAEMKQNKSAKKDSEKNLNLELLNINSSPGMLLKRKFEIQNQNKINKIIILDEI